MNPTRSEVSMKKVIPTMTSTKIVIHSVLMFSMAGVLLSSLMACSHVPEKPAESSTATKSSETPPAAEDGNPMAAPAPTRERILSSYSLLQLDAAANAYKVTMDETMGRSDTPPPGLFGCPITAAQAKGAALPIRNLIDEKIVHEQSSYIRAPAVYLKTRDVHDCEKSCSCAVMVDVLGGLDVRVLKKQEQTRHDELLLELQSKSAKQGAETSMECAKKQNWICGSDLEKYINANLTSEK